MECFVCSEYLNGDDQFIQSHLNHCLDRQGSSTTPSSRTQSSSIEPCTAPSRSSSSSLAPTPYPQDELLALHLAQQQQQQNTSSSLDHLLCPCCQVLWDDINLTFPPFPASTSSASTTASQKEGGAQEVREKIEEKRRKHVEKCLQGRQTYKDPTNDSDFGRLGGSGGGDEDPIQHGSYDDDDDEDEFPNGHVEERTISSTREWTGSIGTKSQVIGTPDLIPFISRALKRSNESGYGRTEEAYLTGREVEHVGTKFGDWGWGCGYKNLQMILSSCRHLPQYESLFQELTNSNHSASSSGVGGAGRFPLPTILEIQKIIEKAWSTGYDPPGALHFNHKLIGSKRWIGTTEVFTALSFLGIRAKIVDFPKVKKGQQEGTNGSAAANNTHQTLIKWIISYFSTPSPTRSASTSSDSTSLEPKNAFETLLSSSSSSSGLVKTVSPYKQPLYLQHQGHSRTIVGVERMKKKNTTSCGGVTGDGEEWLLVFDPGKPIPAELKQLSSPNPSSSSNSGPLAKKVKPNGFGAKASSDGSEIKFGDVLKVFRVNIKDLKKRDEYQILYVEEDGPPLSLKEKEKRKEVMAEVGKSVWVPTSKRANDQ
ncbi:hypothetical protein JCM16303_003161 [Sporobolomyces ruberrimus]